MGKLCKIKQFFDDAFFVRASYYCQQVIYYAIGYPRYSEREIERNSIESDEQAHEYEILRRYNRKLKPSQVLWVVLGLLYVIRELNYIFYALNTAGPARSLVDARASNSSRTNFTNYGCLETNCRRLRPSPGGTLEQDLHEVPLFMICHPHLQPVYTFIHDSSTLGLQSVTLVAFFAIIVGVLLPIRLYLDPSTHETAVYLFAPHTILQNNREFIRRNLVTIHDSLISYYQTFVDREYLTSLLMIDMLRKNSLGATQFGSGFSDTKRLVEREQDFRSKLIDIYRELTETKKLRSDYSRLDDQTKAYIDDCLPLTRLDSWRYTANKRYWLILGLMTFYANTCIAALIVIIFYMKSHLSSHLNQSDEYMNETGCAIWKTSDSEYFRRQAMAGRPVSQLTGAIQLRDYKPVMTFVFVAFSALPMVPLFTIGIYIPCSQAMVYVEELYLRISESVSRLQLCIDYTLELASNGADKTGSTTGSGFDILLQECGFDEVRKAMQRNTRSSAFGLVTMKPLRSNMVQKRLSKLGRLGPYSDTFVSEFVEKNISKFGDNLDAFLSLLTKTLLNIRILGEIIEHSAGNLTNILWVSYTLNYGTMIIIIAYNRKYDDSGWLPLVVATAVILVTNYIISYASSVQTRSNRVLLMMWQLVAITSDFEDIRVKHIRSLFVRQVAVLSQDRGLTMKAFGVSVTYARSIEVTIWTITLIMIAFNIH